MKVPLAYGPRQKFLVRLHEDADLTNKLQLLYHELVLKLAITYDSATKTKSCTKI